MNDEKEDIYNSYYNSHFSRFNKADKEDYEATAKIYDYNYKNILPKNKNASILDCGCGLGHFLYYLEQKGYRNYYGLDISQQQLDICKKLVTANVERINAFEFLRNKNKIYDLIVMNDFLEHIPKKELIPLLKLTYTALKNDGTVIIKVPNMASPFGLRARYIDITHEVGFTEDSLYQILKMVGFNEVHAYGYNDITTSIKNLLKAIIRNIFYRCIRILYAVDRYIKPTILTVNIVAVGKKTERK